MSIRILIAETDLEYALALADALSGYLKEFEVSVRQVDFHDYGATIEMIASQDHELVLLGGCPDHMEASLLFCGQALERIIVLTEYKVQDLLKQSEREGAHLWYIFKYQNVNHIISDLNYLVGAITGKRSLLRKSTAPDLIGFYSMAGGTGKTAVAAGTSRELSRHHDKKVLFLSFEEIPTTSLLFGSNHNNRNLGDYLYFLLEKRDEELCSAPHCFTAADSYGVESFYPTNGRNDLNELKPDELVHFIKILSDSCRYDYIIMDLRNDLSDQTMFLMNLCSKIVIVEDNSPVSRFKNRKCIDYLDRKKTLPYQNRVIIAVNRSAGSDLDMEEEQDLLAEDERGAYRYLKRIHIEDDDCSFRYVRNCLDVDINHSFGIGIKKLTNEIMMGTFSEEGREKGCTENSVL